MLKSLESTIYIIDVFLELVFGYMHACVTFFPTYIYSRHCFKLFRSVSRLPHFEASCILPSV